MAICSSLSIFKLIVVLNYVFLFAGSLACRSDEFVCNNTLCKLLVWLCDGEDDCGDNSDEDSHMCGMSLNN